MKTWDEQVLERLSPILGEEGAKAVLKEVGGPKSGQFDVPEGKYFEVVGALQEIQPDRTDVSHYWIFGAGWDIVGVGVYS